MMFADLSTPAILEPSGVALYEICFLDKNGRRLATETATCLSDKQARVLAHALRPQGTRRIEVWRGTHLVYERPHTLRSASLEVLHGPMTLAAE